MAPVYAYAGSKIAVARWVRRNATKAEWAGTGIRLNAIAPGAIMTPMLEGQLANPQQRKQIEPSQSLSGTSGTRRTLATG